MSKDVNEEEEAARVFQVLLRQKKNCPISPFWESHAFTFDQPPEVAAYLMERAGWAALRRRSTVRRIVEDDKGRAWVEQQDSVRTGEKEEEKTSRWQVLFLLAIARSLLP